MAVLVFKLSYFFSSFVTISLCRASLGSGRLEMSAPAAANTGKPSSNSVDPFTRKSSVKKIVKNQIKKQQGSSRFKSKPSQEIQPLALLKGKTN